MPAPCDEMTALLAEASKPSCGILNYLSLDIIPGGEPTIQAPCLEELTFAHHRMAPGNSGEITEVKEPLAEVARVKSNGVTKTPNESVSNC